MRKKCDTSHLKILLTELWDDVIMVSRVYDVTEVGLE